MTEQNHRIQLQVVGNSSFLDSKLSDWKTSKTTKRVIGCLKFVDLNNGVVSKTDINSKKLETFLQSEFGIEPNNTMKLHLFRTMTAYGLLQINQDVFHITETGRTFLNLIDAELYDDATKYVLLGMMEFHYPSAVVKNIKTIELYPIKLALKLMLETDKFNKTYGSKVFPYINYVQDLDTDTEYADYHKWNQWVFSSLVKMGVLKLDNNDKYEVCEQWKPFLTSYLAGDYEKFFNFYRVLQNEGTLAKSGTSVDERRIYNLIDNYLSEFRVLSSTREFKDPKNGQNFEFDIFVPQLKFAIEYNGVHWHDKDAFQKDDIVDPQTKEMRKSKVAEENEIVLLHVWEDDYLANRDAWHDKIIDTIKQRKIDLGFTK